ncbi:hypothetical protein [Ralstonia sp. 1B3]|uniref:hypothetical protein n=1 Tax=Ralstonia sp. 1B3 TaxID=2997421 RepID=UPI002FC93930
MAISLISTPVNGWRAENFRVRPNKSHESLSLTFCQKERRFVGKNKFGDFLVGGRQLSP